MNSLDESSTSTPRIIGSYSVGGTPRREHIPKNVKMYVWQRDSGRCVTCGSKEKLEYDHIIPLAKGGSNTERNIQLLCERCNRSKGSRIT
jgi:5-methylcytosine-specific restriction endonuclease McrA